jgi:leader peptidase (prepilin peptidase) / N-methyltransferase
LVAWTLGLATATGTRLTVTCVAAVFGLIIGSFLNVVVYRTPRGLSVVRPGSFCPACGTPIRSSDNVPVLAWLALRGRCRHCQEPISARYPAVELLTGVLFGAVAWALGPHWAVPGMCVLIAAALSMASIELDGLAPPASVSLIGTGVGALLLAGAAAADRRWWHLGGMLIGIIVALGAVTAGATAARRSGRGGAPWAVLPAGAVVGWVGPRGAVAGVAVFALILLGLGLLSRAHRTTGPASWREVVALAAALALGAALIAAFVTGAPIGF